MSSSVGNAIKWSATGFSMAMSIAMPMVGQFEGLSQKAYLDAVGIPTICYGETENVRMGQVVSREECDDMFAIRLAWFALRVDQSVKVKMTPERHAALASFAYNVGMDAFDKSTLLRKLNAGDVVGACNELPRWNKAGGRVLRGLTVRREKERQLCLS